MSAAYTLDDRTPLIVGNEIKATALKPIYDNIPAELKATPQWVAWLLAWNPEKHKGKGGTDKPLWNGCRIAGAGFTWRR